jgi:hypothetical protein
MTTQIWLLLLGTVVAGFVQGLSGFAFGMVAMSIWVWGVEPRVAAVMVVFGGPTGQLVAAVSVRGAAHAVVHAAWLRQGPAAQPNPELQPRRALDDDGGLPLHRCGHARHDPVVCLGGAGLADPLAAGTRACTKA